MISEPLRQTAVKKGRWLEYATVGWNCLEAILAIGAGLLAGSVALVGFGFDSVIESLSGVALLWRLHRDDVEKREHSEALALKLVGWCFLILAAYVAFDAGKSLLYREEPEASPIGIAIAALSIVVMPVLARAKRGVAVQIESRALEADARQTDICVYLSFILLAGLGLNWAFGLWWADPVAALVMVPIIVKEGLGALRGESCGCDGGTCHS
jgi:divalent metal cation (Fe/Co/Zn/Cd) transporter